MIRAVSDHIVGRLAHITLDGDPVKVHPPDAEREHGLTEYPHLAVSLVGIRIDFGRSRPVLEVFRPDEEQVTIAVPAEMGGGELTGPEGFTVKPYPTPVRLLYQVDLRTSDPSHAAGLAPLVLQALPVGHQPRIGEYHVLFDPQDPENLDEPAKPLFWTAFRWWVRDVWMDRFDEYHVAGLREPSLELGVTEQEAR